MFKKLLSLSIALVMLSAIGFTEEKAYAEAVTEAKASSFEAIKVNKDTDTGVIKLTGGYKAGSSDNRLTYNGRASSSATTNSTQWFYFKYDISAFQNLEEIESAVLSFAFNFNKNIKGVYIKELKKETWDNAVSDIAKVAEDSTTVIDTTKYPYPYEDTTVETLGTINRESGGNGKTYTYTLTGYGYEYRNDKTISTGFDAWRPVTISAGNLLDYVKEAWTDKEQYLYFAASYAYKSGSSYFVYYQPQSAYNSLKASSDVMVIYNTNNVAYKGSTFYPNYIVYQWPSSLTIPTNITTDFTYSVLVAPAGTKVRLLCAIYGENSELLGVESSNVLTVGTDKTSLKVPLTTKYATATNVKCFLWDGETLRPYTSDFLEKTVEIPAAE